MAPLTFGIRETGSQIILSAIIVDKVEEINKKVCLAVKEEWGYDKVVIEQDHPSEGLILKCYPEMADGYNHSDLDDDDIDTRKISVDPFTIY